MEHGRNTILIQDRDGSTEKMDQLILWWVQCLFAGVYHFYMLNVKLWYGRWSAWRPYKFQRWCLQQTVLNWWRWCLHRQNGRCSLHTWRSFYDVRNSFLTLLSSIYRGRKILWRTNWHAVLGLRHLLWFMLILFPRGGSRIRNLPSFLAFCCKKKKKILCKLFSFDAEKIFLTINKRKKLYCYSNRPSTYLCVYIQLFTWTSRCLKY